MKFFNSVGPNPHVVRMFMAEKGLTIPTVTVDLMAGENRQADHLARNPMGQTPALELDDGSYLTEILPICEYLEEIHPSPALVGSTPEARAKTRMWTRRLDLHIVEPLTNGFRYSEGLALFKERVTCMPEAAQGLKALAQEWLRWLEGQMTDRTYIVGDHLTLADIHLYCFLAFGNAVGQPLNPDLKALSAWFERIKARPSASA